MILNETSVNVESSKKFESTEFRIDAKYKNKVLWMLINQYKHKVRTPVQEIISNARDAQRENGNPDTPIYVQLPTKLEPTFIVRDFGVGMNEDRIKTIFTSFGASTKNSDNAQTGGFGIGAKSPLAYTDQFNIKTYVNGKFWYYVVAKTEDDGIGLHLLASGDTTEKNGTEVQIPVKPQDVETFKNAAYRCTMFWDVQPEFNTGENGAQLLTGDHVTQDNVKLYKGLNDFDSGIYMVVDGIPYKVDRYLERKIPSLDKIDDMVAYNTACFISINTGDIDLLQTRESIEDTERTISQLSIIGEKSLQSINTYKNNALNDKTLLGRIHQFNLLCNVLNVSGSHNFKGISITSRNIKLIDELDLFSYDYRGKRGTTKSIQRQNYSDYSKNTLKQGYLVNLYYDDLGDKESSTMKNKRLRNVLLSDNESDVTLLSQGTASSLLFNSTANNLQASKLSSLPLPAKNVTTKKQRTIKAKTEKVTIHEIKVSRWSHSPEKNTEDILLKDNKTKFVYIGYFAYASEFECKDWINLLKDTYNLTPVKLSEKVTKLIKNDANFIKLEDFKAQFKPTQAMVDTVIGRCLGTSSEIKFINDNSRKLSDKILGKMAQHLVYKIDDSLTLPKSLSVSIANEYSEKIKAKKIITGRINKRIRTKYQLLDIRQGRATNVNYINIMNKGVK